MNEHLKTIFDFIQQNENLTTDEKNTFSKAVKDVDKELTITAFKLDRTEKVKRTTAILLEETIEELEQKRKAVEMQNRELEIEAALERIRAAAMAMRDSSALSGIIYKLYSELTNLDAKLDRCFIMIVNPENQGITWWMAGQEGLLAENGFFVQMNQHASHLMYLDYCKKREKKWTYLFEGKEKRDWDRFGFSKTELARLPEPIKAFMAAAKEVYLSGSSDQFGSLVTGSFEPLPDEQQEIISRFSVAFNQTYTRFLDLQKAEANAREAQIEAGLERFRSRMLGMQKSSELEETTTVMYQQINALGIVPEGAMVYIVIIDRKADTAHQWIVSDKTLVIPPEGELRVPMNEHPQLIKTYEAWKRKEPLLIRDISGEEMEDFRNYFLSLPSFQQIKSEIDQWPDRMVWSEASFSNGTLGLIFTTPLPQATLDILVRFSKVFDLTYTRFLDIQNAEDQAREAQIEAALEKVRSSSLAMQNSGQIREIVKVVFEKLKDLKFAIDGGVFVATIPNNSDYVNYWIGDDHAEYPGSFKIPNYDAPTITDVWNAQKSGAEFISKTYSFQEKNIWFEYAFNNTDLKTALPEDFKKWILEQEYLTQSFAMQKNSMIGVHFHHAKTLTENEIDILKRFSRVFEQSYVRFLDLQKAEAQAREAKIEGALEKVRSRSLAMHHSFELEQVAVSLFNRLVELGLTLDGALIFIFEKEKRNIRLWIATNHLPDPVKIDLPYDEEIKNNAIIKDLWNGIENGEHIINRSYSGETKNDYFRYVAKYNESKVPESVRKIQIEADNWTTNFAAEKNSLIGFDSWTGHTITIEDFQTIIRFARVFEQAYTRFLDLQKAEAQARESQIELGLERVRARAMAMQKSDELAELVDTVFKELTKLDVHLDRCIIMINDLKTNGSTWWLANPELGSVPVGLFVKYHEHQPNLDYINAWKQRTLKWQYLLEGINKKKWDSFLFTETDLSFLPDFVIAGMKSFDRIFLNVSFNNFGSLTVSSVEPLQEEHFDVMLRFAKVFDLTYTRFNDLKQAEAQARESQIQLALERVRARTMAMQRSDELQDAALLLFQQIEGLGMPPFACGFNIWDDDRKAATAWMRSIGSLQPPFKTDSSRDIYLPIYETAQIGESLFVIEQSGKELEVHYQYLATIPTFRDIIMEDWKRSGVSVPTFQIIHCAYFTHGYLMFISFEPVPAYYDIFKRFAKVFEQTYTRFLDLQKAEAQAREAQIEASLERLRSKTMAMHNSHDVGESVATIFDELARLEVKTNRCGVLIHGDSADAEVWTAKSNPEGKAALIIGHLDMTIHPMLSGVRNSWLNKESSFTYELAGEDIKNYFQAINDTKTYPHHFNIDTLPSREYHSDFHFRDGSIFAFTPEPIPAEALLIFTRFAGVFGQTYRRYLDLQKAEAQAREAQIEAALERVRAKTMAMHKSEQLPQTAQVLFEQFAELGKMPDRIGIGIIKEESQVIEWWVTDQMGSQVTRQFEATVLQPTNAKWVSAWKEGKDALVIDLSGEALKEWIRFVKDELKMPIDESQIKGRRVQHAAFFSRGLLLISAHEPMANETMQLLVRFARVFNQTYTRFLDLQKAETQAKEAIKASSLDRVRGEIASMRTVDDLQRITPIIWHELIALGVPFVRCGVFIIDESKEHIQVHLSSPDGSSLGALDLPFDSSELTINSVNQWRQGVIFKTHWDKQEFLNFMQTMIKEGQVQNQETYQGAAQPPESLHLHFVPFKQGMLYVGNISPLEIDELQLVKSLAESFSIAYARYEDFRQLEEAKNQIEKTFTELKAAQAQLIQAEKMASLGELTAGIAHEIQNPLNFVNNFSELSNELIEEMKEELEDSSRQYAAGSRQLGEEKLNLAKEIASEIIQNLEKINHHGKRAADIVKGMLLHSRTSSGQKEPTDINALADEYLRLAYHGLRAKDKSFNATMVTDFDETIGKINIIPQDIGRVILNLITNAFYAVDKKAKSSDPLTSRSESGTGSEGGMKNDQIKFVPTVTICTTSLNPPSGASPDLSGGRGVRVVVKDNGEGIPSHIVDKIFQPFFTTKPTGQGTGLGLSLAYDIVKAHGGELKVETKEGEGSKFIIQLSTV